VSGIFIAAHQEFATAAASLPLMIATAKRWAFCSWTESWLKVVKTPGGSTAAAVYAHESVVVNPTFNLCSGLRRESLGRPLFWIIFRWTGSRVVSRNEKKLEATLNRCRVVRCFRSLKEYAEAIAAGLMSRLWKRLALVTA